MRINDYILKGRWKIRTWHEIKIPQIIINNKKIIINEHINWKLYKMRVQCHISYEIPELLVFSFFFFILNHLVVGRNTATMIQGVTNSLAVIKFSTWEWQATAPWFVFKLKQNCVAIWPCVFKVKKCESNH